MGLHERAVARELVGGSRFIIGELRAPQDARHGAQDLRARGGTIVDRDAEDVDGDAANRRFGLLELRLRRLFARSQDEGHEDAGPISDHLAQVERR
jgi:hypothetical protein